MCLYYSQLAELCNTRGKTQPLAMENFEEESIKNNHKKKDWNFL